MISFQGSLMSLVLEGLKNHFLRLVKSLTILPIMKSLTHLHFKKMLVPKVLKQELEILTRISITLTTLSLELCPPNNYPAVHHTTL